ncbi:ribonuclease H-like domain-containing protein [Tanacetum coccineum]|uniref:Ribonuclease H-like domain-containing protein n=1 Tax=Tanacetum coccineum TaxID=301880 RepID=A0ABQ5D7A5_9ASTR
MSQPANDNFSLHDDEELSLHDDASLDGSVPATNKGDAPAKPPQIITTNTLSNIKLPVLQKDDYDTWAMEMEHYLEYIDNEVWKVIQNGNSKKRVTKGKDGVYRVLPPATQEEQFADEKERKARTLLLMAVPKDHLRRFHGMDDAKEIWAAIKTRFGGNANSKKMQKAVLKQQFEAFTISSKESLEKGYDRFQKLLSQLDALGAGVSDEDANHKFLRSLPPAWDSLAMTMRTKKNIDTLSIDDLYNNLSVFEQDIQKTSSSSLTSDNVAFLSQAKASSSKHKPSHSSGSYSSYTTSSSKATTTATPGLADEVIHSFLATNADDVDLIHEDLDQIDDLDLEDKVLFLWLKTNESEDDTIVKMYPRWGLPLLTLFQLLGLGHLMTIDEGQINWVEQTTDEELNHALMAFTVNNEVSMCSKLCLDFIVMTTAKYDELQSEFGDPEAGLVAHKLAVKKLESQLRASHKQQTSLTEKLNFQANQIFEKDEKLKKYRRIGMKAVKDKDALQKIVDSWCASSKNLWKLIDCGMSSTVKIGLGYGIQSNAEVLGYEEEISRGIFAFRETDARYNDIPLYSRFKQVEYKGVPHPLSGDYTPREQEDIDDSLYEYGKYGPQPQSPSPTVSDTSSTAYSTCPSNDSDGELGAVSDHSVNDDPIHDHIPIPSIEQVTIVTQKTQPQVSKPKQTVVPSCAQHVKTPRQPIRTPVTPSPIPSNNRQNWNQQMDRELGAGYSFERKPCFVCGSLSHLIKDCDYYEKKMAREAALKSQRVVHADVRQATPAWTNTNRVNKANQFTPRPVQLSNIRPNLSTASKTIKTGRVNVNTGHGNVSTVSSAGTQIKSGSSRFNTGKQNVNSGSVHVNTARVIRPVSNQTSYKTSPKLSQVNLNSPKKCFSKQSSPVNRHFSRITAHKSNKYAVKGKMGTAVKTSAGCVWRKTTPHSNTNKDQPLIQMFIVSQGPTRQPKPVKARSQRETNLFLYAGHPMKHMGGIEAFLIVDVWHMTGNRGPIFEDYQELKPKWDLLLLRKRLIRANTEAITPRADHEKRDVDVPTNLTLRFNNAHPSKANPLMIPNTLECLKALEDESRVEACKEEQLQLQASHIWDEGEILSKPSKASSSRSSDKKRIDYMRSFCTCKQGIEAIRLFLAFASFMGFIVYQMDVKSAFLYGTIDEEVYVSQPPGFVDPAHPTKVYKSSRTRKASSYLKTSNSKDFLISMRQEDLQVPHGQTKLNGIGNPHREWPNRSYPTVEVLHLEKFSLHTKANMVHQPCNCISCKSGDDQFGINIATLTFALICLSTGQEHAAQAQTQPLPPPPPIPSPTPTPIPTSTSPPPPIPTPTSPPPPPTETEPPTDKHI